MKKKMKTIVFYSYKGGTGRTLLLANCARYLASNNKKVIAIDFDLEAPGLNFKFPEFDVKEKPVGNCVESMQGLGLIDLILLCQEYSKLPSDNYIKEHVREVKEKDYSFNLVPAGNAPCQNYTTKMLTLNWRELLPTVGENIGIPFFKMLKEKLKEIYEPDYMLIDSRTGITDIGTVALKFLADKYVCLFLNNPENIAGTRYILDRLKKYGVSKENIIPILSRIPPSNSEKSDDEIKREVREALDLESSDPYVLYDEPSLHVVEELHIGGEKSFKESVLLHDYIALFDDLFKDEEFEKADLYVRKILKRFSRYKEDDEKYRRNVSKKIDIIKDISKNKNLKVVQPQYVKGEPYEEFITSITTKLCSKNSLEKPSYVFSNGAWDFYAGSIMDKHFHFCCDPYYLTKSRNRFIDVIQIGWVQDATYYLEENSPIYELFKNKESQEIKDSIRGFLKKDHNKKFKIGILGETAAARKSVSYFSSQLPHDSIKRKWDTEDLANWLWEESENTVLIIDHDVAKKVDDIIKNKNKKSEDKKSFIFYNTNNMQTDSERDKELIFNFEEDIPVGFIYPTEDKEWRRHVVTTILELIFKEKKIDEDMWKGIIKNLHASNIKAFEYEQFVHHLLMELSYKEAITWIKEHNISI